MPKLMPLPTMIEPRNAVFELSGQQIGQRRKRGKAECENRREEERRHEDGDTRPPPIVDENHRDHEPDDDDARDRQIADESARLLHVDRDVAREAHAQGRRIVRDVKVVDIAPNTTEELCGPRMARVEGGEANEEERQVKRCAGEAVVVESVATFVFVLDVAKVERRRWGVLVQKLSRGFLDVVVAPGLDARAQRLEVCKVRIDGKMAFDESPFRGVAGPHVVHERWRIGAYAGRQVVEESLGRGQLTRVAAVHHDTEMLQSRHPRTQLVQRDDARRVRRQELLEIAPEVEIEASRTVRRWDGQKEGREPKPTAMA